MAHTSHEYGANTLEAIRESSGVMPESASDVMIVLMTAGSATTNANTKNLVSQGIQSNHSICTYIPMKMNITTTSNFKHDDQNSSSANPSVPKTEAMAKARVGDQAETIKKDDLTDYHPEDSYPGSYWNLIRPILYSCASDSDFQRKYDRPLEDVVPTHGEGERRIQESASKCIKASRHGV